MFPTLFQPRMKILCILPVFALSSLFAAETLLSRLDLKLVDQSWGAAGSDRSVSGKPLSVAGTAYQFGVGTHAHSEIVVALSPGTTRFKAKVGVDDASSRAGSVEFKVLADRELLWSSGVMRGGEAAKPVDVDVTGRAKITLSVTDAGDGNSHDHADWLDAVFVHAGAAPIILRTRDAEPGRLTPPTPPHPRFNGAKVFGVRPGAPLLFRLAVSGERPMRFVAEGLPPGTQLDPATGIITGRVDRRDEFPVKVTVTNAKGVASGTLKLVVGDRIALTPPMGWNSWYCFSEGVDEASVRAMAKAMDESGLADHGWSYVNIDDCWQAERRTASGDIVPNARFPDMSAMTGYIHSLGLRAGLYSTPWMGSYAGFIGGSAPDKAYDYAKYALPEDKRLQPAQIFGRYPGFAKQGMDKVGPVWLFDRDAKCFASWGFDYLKVDWKPIDIPTTRGVSEAVRASGRDIVLSLSNEATLAWASDYGKYAELWRTSGDIHDSWGSVANIGFNRNPSWREWSKPGNWNDPDMLQVGYIGVPNRANAGHPTNLTPNEQYAKVSLWAIQAAPLILSCDLRKLDDFTLGLLTNPEVIAVDQDPLGVAGKKIEIARDFTAFVKPLEDGSYAVALFNRAEKAADLSVTLERLGLSGRFVVRDLWRMVDEGEVSESIAARIGRHGVKLVKLTPR